MRRPGCFSLILCLAMLIGGGQNVYTYASNRSITEVGIDSIARDPPSAKWLRITGGELDTANAAYTSLLGVGKASEVYVPLVPPGVDSEKETIHLLVLSKEPELLAFTNQMRELEKSGAKTEAMLTFLAKNADKLRPARPVEGLVKFGVESASSEKERKIRELYPNLSPKFILLEEGAKPSIGFGLAMLTGGILLSILLINRARKKEDGLPPAQSPAPPAAPPPAA